MKETVDVLAFFASHDGVARFFALFFPGFVATAVYDARIPGERRKWADMGVALVAYSVIIDAIVTLVLFWWPIPTSDTARTILFGTIFDAVAPALAGWFIVDLREWLATRGLILSAWPKAWDAFFNRIRKRNDIALLITLSDGRKVGGFWASNPFASSFPADEDLLITTVMHVDETTRRFTKLVTSAQGLLVKRDDIITIEAFDAKVVIEQAIADANALAATTPAAPTGGPLE